MRSKFLLFVALIVLLLPISTNLLQAQDDILRLSGGAGDPRSIDPQQGIDMRDWYLLNLLFPGLVSLDEESNQLEPGFVNNWEISEDGLTTTFHLIEGIPWVSYNSESGEVEPVMDDMGNPRIVTAQDVVYGFRRALDPATGTFSAFMLAPLVEGGESFNAGESDGSDLGVRAIGDFTFEVTAPAAVGYALNLYSLMSARPSPQWAIDENQDRWIEAENIQTFGPYALKDWVHDDSMTFVRNPFWPGSKGYAQAKAAEIVFRFLDQGVSLTEYEAGNLDTVTPPNDQIPRLKADPVLSQELTLAPGACSFVLGFHTQKAPFDNVHIRHAFSYAIDRELFVDSVLQGAGIPARWVTPPSIYLAPTLETDPDIGIAYDPMKADEYLAMALDELGYESVSELPPITVYFRDREGEHIRAQAFQVMWEEELGIRVELAPQDPTTYWARAIEDAGPIHFAGWCPDYNDANNFLRDQYLSSGQYNYGRYASEQFDALVNQAQTENDPDIRRELYRQAEQLLVVEDAAIVPISWGVVPTLTKPNVYRTFVPSSLQSFWKWEKTEG